jgi:hypothetical protein
MLQACSELLIRSPKRQFVLEVLLQTPIMRGVSQPSGIIRTAPSSAEDIVINRSESRLIALERRNRAARAARKQPGRIVESGARSANDEVSPPVAAKAS